MWGDGVPVPASRKINKSPLISSSSFPLISSVLLSSLRDETQNATLCCLSAFNICLPLPLSPHKYTSAGCEHLICPSLILSLFLSPSWVQFLQPEQYCLYYLLFSPTLSLCLSVPLSCLLCLVFTSMSCSARPQQVFCISPFKQQPSCDVDLCRTEHGRIIFITPC